MTESLEDAVVRHYGVSDLAQRIFRALAAAGVTSERLTPEQLAPVDEFHIGGRPATEYALAKIELTGSDHVLDVGCGLGGATRYLASTVGCRVTGIDLTADYIEVAELLADRTGLRERMSYETASALSMPFAAAMFDAAITFHAAMNIGDRVGLYREIARVLKPGAALCIYDVMQGAVPGLRFPVPWADSVATSHLTTPDEMQDLLIGAGFQVEEVDDRTDFGIEFFRQRLSDTAGGPPPLGLHLLMGPRAREKLENMLHGLEMGHVAPVIMTARRLNEASQSGSPPEEA